MPDRRVAGATFYAGLAALVLCELARVYFIMPLPGSQRIHSIDVAYLLHGYRWWLRAACLLAIAAGAVSVVQLRPRWPPAVATLAALALIGYVDLEMTAEGMFAPPHQLSMLPRATSTIDESSLVLGVERNGEASAYPIRFLVYYHRVEDVVGGEPVLVTYCNVCRTGRVYSPVVEGRPERFRLVGMDHFNAMFEDASTGSWWRQATGEAVTGPRKGAVLREIASGQLTLREWFALHPGSRVMQPDPASRDEYDDKARFERGESKGNLTRTDPGSWQEKSWVVGVQVGGASKAYDWNELKRRRVLNDVCGDRPIVVVLGEDGQSFAAFERPAAATEVTLDGDVLLAGGRRYDLAGRDLAAPAQRLAPVPAYQEFWHSWRTFHPGTARGP